MFNAFQRICYLLRFLDDNPNTTTWKRIPYISDAQVYSQAVSYANGGVRIFDPRKNEFFVSGYDDNVIPLSEWQGAWTDSSKLFITTDYLPQNLARTAQLHKWRYMQDVLNGMSPDDAWAKHGSSLFSRAEFEGYTRAESDYRFWSKAFGGMLLLPGVVVYGSVAVPQALTYLPKAWAANKISFGFELGTQTLFNKFY